MPDPQVYVALAAQAAGLQPQLNDFIARLDQAGVHLEDDSLDRANLLLHQLARTLVDRARQAEQATGEGLVWKLGWSRPYAPEGQATTEGEAPCRS